MRKTETSDKTLYLLLTAVVILLAACLIGTVILLSISKGLPPPPPEGSGTTDTGDTSGTDDTSDTDDTDPPVTYVYKIKIDEYLPAITSVDLTLVNKSHPCDADPTDLVTLTCATFGDKEIGLDGTAAEALYAMLAEMEADGIGGVSVTSAYRAYSYQVSLFGAYVAQEMARHPDWTREEAEAEVLTYSAAPGTSEHQSGLCVDLFAEGMRELENYGREGDYPDDIGFAETDAYPWLLENAHRFGFILRYPQGKEGVTGYAYESWHYRFVGRDAAAVIFKKGITLEEYLNTLE